MLPKRGKDTQNTVHSLHSPKIIQIALFLFTTYVPVKKDFLRIASSLILIFHFFFFTVYVFLTRYLWSIISNSWCSVLKTQCNTLVWKEKGKREKETSLYLPIQRGGD